MIRISRFSIFGVLAAMSVACAPINPNMPHEIRYVPEDSCSDALAQAFTIASSGDPGGQYSMGVLWSRGCGVPRHHRNAYDWFMLSANGGDARAILKLGDMHRNGEAVEQDDEKAAEWYSLAARMGSGDAIGKLQGMGRPVPYADLAAHVSAPAGRGWLAEFAEAFLIGAAAYYGVYAVAPATAASAAGSPSVRVQSPSTRQVYKTNCFVRSFGSYVNVDCRTR
jgi:TPR repeat protein